MKKKAITWSLQGLGSLILTAIVSVILIILIFKYLGLISLEKSEKELSMRVFFTIESYIKTLSENNLDTELIIENLKDWHFITYASSNKLCKSDFCFCICKEPDCSGAGTCNPVKNYVLLRDENRFEKKAITLDNVPHNFKLKYYPESVYVIDVHSSYGKFLDAPLFFRLINNSWEFSLDLTTWTNVSKKSEFNNKEKIFSSENKLILEQVYNLDINSNNKELSNSLIEKIFIDSGFIKSKVIILEK
jgi:hypothetical protein